MGYLCHYKFTALRKIIQIYYKRYLFCNINQIELEYNLETLVKNSKNEILKQERQQQETENKKHHYKYEKVFSVILIS